MGNNSVVGFDFGTTNSLVSSIRGGRAINFLDKEGLPFPSVVCYEGAKKIVGRDAKERLGEAGLGVKGNIVYSPKLLLGRENVFIDGVERNPVDIVSDVLTYISQQVRVGRRGKELGKIDRAIVTIPVDMEGYRRVLLRDAFRLAGISIVQFVHEPLAALYGFFKSQDDMATMLRRYDRKLMLVFDWGGGTLDLTICRLVNGMLVQLANDGTEDVGGDVFDDAIQNEIVRRVLKARNLDKTVQYQPDAKIRMRQYCERAKIDLSSRGNIELYVRGFFQSVSDKALSYSLNRDALEDMTKSLLDKGFSRIDKLLEAAGISHAQIALCLATGGMTNMPTIKARLHEWFGPQRVQMPERNGTLIAEGAAWIAHDGARLRLAKNVELLLARNSYMPLVQATTLMPSEGEVESDKFHLYCCDPRDGFAKFQLCAPIRPGMKVLPNDRRHPLVNLIVEVDSEAKPFHERLELDISVDDNLILKAQARSLNKQSLAEEEVHNLEFGLSFPTTTGDLLEEGAEESVNVSEGVIENEAGSIVFRSNITNREDNSLIPGELLYSYDPYYFDKRHDPPRVQVQERLFYEPCSRCRRASNDPLCRCSSLLK
ncbi:Hsp70 family protein [Candidatus Spongiihabitans sp.]|uniref:Hsp70 family protein n=1 Tax=Candidatus Spongiihabitans sp. TaxID=3101308 RepID=UPI003C7B5631